MIEIWDASSVHLSELLSAVPATIDLNWSILEIWAVARNDEMDMVALEREAADSPTGLRLQREQLAGLAGELLQVIDGIVVGYRGDPPSRSNADLRGSSEIVIEAIDSTLWRVYARDQAVIEALLGAFPGARDVDPEVALPPVHDRT